MDESKNSGKTRHRFAKGNQHGKGRPQGSRNSATIALQKLLDGEGEEITRTAIEMAVAGNETALRLCFERLLPVRKDRPVTVKLPSVIDAKGIGDAFDQLLSQVSKGNLTPMEASTLAGILESRRKTLETEVLEARVAAIEAMAK